MGLTKYSMNRLTCVQSTIQAGNWIGQSYAFFATLYPDLAIKVQRALWCVKADGWMLGKSCGGHMETKNLLMGIEEDQRSNMPPQRKIPEAKKRDGIAGQTCLASSSMLQFKSWLN
eukprot:1158844-Pelagomonas_calceolata.AAC.7